MVKTKKSLSSFVFLTGRFGNTFVYDGLTFSIGGLAGDPYLNNTYSALVELAGIIASHIAFTKIGRKIPYTVNMFIAGAVLVCISFVPASKPTLGQLTTRLFSPGFCCF